MAIRASRIKDNKPVISEKVFTAQVIKAARVYGWVSAHFRPAMTKRGNWVTAVAGDGAGFVDLVLVKSGFLLLVELKSDIGKLEPRQEEWGKELTRVMACCGPMVRYFVWRPKDYDWIIEILSK